MKENRWLKYPQEIAIFLIIVIIAGFLRLWNLDSASFTYDAALLANMAADFVATGRLPLQGMVSSTGVQNPALALYLFSIPVALRPGDPKIILIFVALLNTAAVGGLYWLGRRYWSRSVGALAALLFATGAWAVHYGRQIWPPSLIPPANVALLAILLTWAVKRSSWAMAATIVAQAALVQLNFSAIALMPMIAGLLVVELTMVYHRREPERFWRPAALGGGLSLLLYMPYLWAEAQNGWPSIRRFVELLRTPSRLHPQVFDLAAMMVGGRNIHSLAGAQRFQEFMAGLVDPTYGLERFAEGIVVLAILFLFIRLWHKRHDYTACRRDGLLLFWPASILFFFLRSGTDVHPHYFVALYPVPHLLLAVVVVDVLRRLAGAAPWRRALGAAMIGSVGLFALWQGYLSVSVYRFVATHDTPGGWGEPIAISSAVAANIERYAEHYQATDVVMLCSGADPRFDECPAVYRYLTRRSSRSVAFMDRNDRNIWTRAADTESLVVLAPGGGLAAAELPQFAQPIPEAGVPLREGVDAYRFFRIHNPYQDIAARLADTAPSESAIILVGRNQETELRRFYRGSLPVYELPGPSHSTEDAAVQLAQIAERYSALFVLLRASEDVDPEGVLYTWLMTHTYPIMDAWLSTVHLVETRSPHSDTALWWSERPEADFNGRLRLRDYSLSAAVRAGEPLLIRLVWDATTTLDADYAAFTQLWDDQAHVIAQRDIRLQFMGRTSGGSSEIRSGLIIPPATRPGVYRLIAGVYDLRTGQRLPVSGADYITLRPIQIHISD